MTAALLIIGAGCLLIGWVFFWLNLNSPIQTSIPAVMLPLGAALLLLGLGKLIA